MLDDQTPSGEEMSSSLSGSLVVAGAVVASAVGVVGDGRQQAGGFLWAVTTLLLSQTWLFTSL